MVNNYLKLTKIDKWSCGRCWDENTKSNTSDILFIQEKQIDGEYAIDFGNCFWALIKTDFDKQDFIEHWKNK